MSAAAQQEKTLRALRTDSTIRLDGILDDLPWSSAESISDFVQQEPHVDQPVSERTEVRVLFDNEAVYFGIACYASDPNGIIARELRRDNPLIDDDRFEIVLDTFHDHRNAFHFVVNPLGTQYDALITDEGQDINVEWDERWWAETRMSDEGWMAEIKIPFTSLRSREGVDTFGVNFKRFIRRKNETAQWTGWDRDFLFTQVSQAGHLVGIRGVQTGLRLRIKPYLLAGFDQRARSTGTDPRNDVGMEVLKFSLTPSLTAELTANTDFAQADIDEAIVNLTRFPVFYPEKREFFLERAGIFEFGPGARRGATGALERNLQMFFPRRIGLTDDRRPVPMIWGGKLIGRGRGLDLGLLNAQTGRFEGTPGSNYTVFRVKRNVLARSNIGAFVTNRQRLSSGAKIEDFNRVIGADANFTILKNTDIQGFIGKSFTPGRNGNDYVGRFKFNWFSDIYEAYVDHIYVGPDFRNDIGFVRRKGGHQRTENVFVWEPRPDVLNIRFLVFRGQVVYVTDIHRKLLTREQIFQFTTRFQNDDAVRFNTTNIMDRLEEPFAITRGITLPGTEYQYRENFLEAESSPQRPLFGRVRYGWGDFYNGRRKYVQLVPSFKPVPRLSLETSYEFNSVRLREGSFKTHVTNARVNFNLSNKWLTSTVVQYDSESRRNVLFFRLNYIFRPGDDLFIVFNQSTPLGTTARDRVDRTLMVKWTYSFDF